MEFGHKIVVDGCDDEGGVDELGENENWVPQWLVENCVRPQQRVCWRFGKNGCSDDRERLLRQYVGESNENVGGCDGWLVFVVLGAEGDNCP